MTPDELDMVETEALMQALARRCDGLVCIVTTDRNQQRESSWVWYSGGWVKALGLVEFGKQEMLRMRETKGKES